MAKRRRSSAAGFLQGLQTGYSMTRGFMQDREMSSIADEQPTSETQYGDPTQQQLNRAEAYNQDIADQDARTFGDDPYARGNAADYQYGDGKAVTGTKYSYNGVTQDAPFGKAQLTGLKMDRMADVYAKYGSPEKAMQLRAQGLSMQGEEQRQKLTGLQYEQAQRDGENQKYLMSVMNLARRGADMSDDDFMREAAKLATHGVQDGASFGVHKDPATGRYMVAGVDGNTGKAMVKPVGSRDDVVRMLISYATPQNFLANQTYEAGRADRADDVAHRGRQAKVVEDNAAETARHNKTVEGLRAREIAAMDRYRQTIAGSKTAGTPVGLSDDGKGVVYSTPEGLVLRPLPAGVSGDKLFPKTTGMRPPNPEAEKAYYKWAADNPDATPAQDMRMRHRFGLSGGQDIPMPSADSIYAVKRAAAAQRGEHAGRDAVTDPVVADLEARIRAAAVKGDAATVQKLQIGLQQYVRVQGKNDRMVDF